MVDFTKHLRQPLPLAGDLALPKLGARTAPLCTVRTVQESTDVESKEGHVLPIRSVEDGLSTRADDARETMLATTNAPQEVKPARPCGCSDTDLCLHGIPASIGVDEPITWRQEYLGQPRVQGGGMADAPGSMSMPLKAQTVRPGGESVDGGAQPPMPRAGSSPAPVIQLGVEPLWPDPCPPFTYIAGAAGSGKTFALKEWAARERGLVLTASTGIASVNLGEGQTINSLLGYFDTRSLQESYVNGFLTARLGRLWKSGVRRILLDEVSMVSGDQLTYMVKAIEEVNGRGYVLGKWDAEDETEPPSMGLTLCGDFAQLAPVKEPYAFESPEWHRFAAHTKTLTEIRRQADPAFIQALRQARVGNGRAVLDYFVGRLQVDTDDQFEGPTLLAKNEAVDRYNWLRLSKVGGADLYFESAREGKQRSEWGDPKKPPASWGVPLRLHLKVGALVMVLANRKMEGPPPQPYVYVNGDLGEVVSGDEHTCVVKLQRTGREVPVEFVRREVLQPCDAARRKELRAAGKEDAISENGKFEIVGWISYMPLRVAYASTVHKCVAPYTRIQTLSSGVVTFRDLRVGDVLPTGVVKAIVRTEQSAYSITTKLGYTVHCSADHRWLTESGLRTTRELLVGEDRLQLALGRPSGGITFPAEDAYWLGLLVGDGNYTDQDDGTLNFSSITDPELGESFARGALRLGAQKCSWRKDRRGLHTTCRALRNQLLGWGVDYVTAPSKTIPTIIWQADSGVWAAFLRGLYDADGSVGKSGVIFCTASTTLAREVQELLLLLGIVSRRQAYPGRKDPYYQVYIGARGLSAFKALIGFGGVRKRRRLAETLPNRSLTTFEGFDTVASVEKLGLLIPMIDVEITAPHLVGFGPFMGHNSQGLSLDRVQVNIRDAFFRTPGMLYVALSRARSAEGLRLVGSEAALVERCTADPRLAAWL